MSLPKDLSFATYFRTLLPALLMTFAGCSDVRKSPDPGGENMDTTMIAQKIPPPAKDSGMAALERLKGEWVTERFDRNLRKSRSVFRAIDEGRGKRILWLDVRPDSIWWQFVYSFDLYDSAIRTFDSLADAGTSGASGMKLYQGVHGTIGIAGDGERFHWMNRANGPVVTDSFIRLHSNFERYLASALVAGRYRDEKGRSVILDEDGEMTWGEEKLRYKVGQYFFLGLPADDYLKITGRLDGADTTRLYGFRWKKEKLHLYKIVETKEDPAHDSAPLHILTRL